MRVLSLGGEVGGRRLLSQKTIDLVFDQQSDGVDLVLGEPFRFGIGYCLGSPRRARTCPRGGRCFWGGWGGSMIVMDLDRRLTISYMMNKMAPGHPRLRPRRVLRPRGLRRAHLTPGQPGRPPVWWTGPDSYARTAI